MSLINEALKKAQRQRDEEQAHPAAPTAGGGTRRSERPPARAAQSLTLMAASSIALIVVGTVVTVSWRHRSASDNPTFVTPTFTKTGADTDLSLLILAPLPTRDAAAEPAAGSSPAATAPKLVTRLAPATLPAPMPSSLSAPVLDLATLPPSAASSFAPRELVPSAARPADPVFPASTTSAAKFDGRMQALVDGFRVSGIRAFGSESKVLLNEKMYKINDIIDRANGLCLTQVASDRLTFTTPDGVTYIKNF